MKQGWAFAWRSLMAAEIYITILTGFGLGHLLHFGRELHAMDTVIGIMLVIVGIGLLATSLRGPCEPSGEAHGHISVQREANSWQVWQGPPASFRL